MEQESRMDWILLISLQWITLGSPPPPTTQTIGPFASEQLCNKAAEAIREELSAPIQGQHVVTLGRLVCFALKDKDGQKSEAGAK
jgi:hypothetical protein